MKKEGKDYNVENKVNAHEFLGKFFDNLREIWIEIPGDCPLDCIYCFATDPIIKHKKPIDESKDLLSVEEIINNIKHFDEDFPLTKEEKLQGIKKNWLFQRQENLSLQRE